MEKSCVPTDDEIRKVLVRLRRYPDPDVEFPMDRAGWPTTISDLIRRIENRDPVALEIAMRLSKLDRSGGGVTT